MRPKRKGPDAIPGSDDGDMPGTAVLDLQVESVFRPPSQPTVNHQQLRPSVTQVPIPLPVGAAVHNGPVQQLRPTATTMPPRTNITSGSALTPPEETAQTRKRFMPQPSSSNTTQQHAKAADHRNAVTVSHQATTSPEKRRRVNNNNSNNNNAANNNNNSASVAATSSSHVDGGSNGILAVAGRQLLEDSLTGIAEALRARIPQRWPEQAMEIFFREFSDEDMDLQLKIAEKVLGDENKAMVFCKMPSALREHWVKRLREVHNRST